MPNATDAPRIHFEDDETCRDAETFEDGWLAWYEADLAAGRVAPAEIAGRWNESAR